MTTTDTTEQALEACIEKALTGTRKEERGEGIIGEEEREPMYGPHAPAIGLGLRQTLTASLLLIELSSGGFWKRPKRMNWPS